MMDILGVGVLIRGDSGLGKSEAVLALIERGYSLVSDDVTRLTLVGGHDVIGTSPELTRNHMEIRGIGIINVAAMFGVKSVCKEKKLDLVVTLKPANELPDMEQLGMEQEFVKVLGANIPHIFIPVQLGRELSRLIEVAAYQTKLRMSGYNAAQELEDRLIAQMTSSKPARA
jgi:HPr kinase/phosphorylase